MRGGNSPSAVDMGMLVKLFPEVIQGSWSLNLTPLQMDIIMMMIIIFKLYSLFLSFYIFLSSPYILITNISLYMLKNITIMLAS